MQRSRGALGALFSLLVAPLLVAARPAAAQTGTADPLRGLIEKEAKAFSDAFAKGDFKTLAGMYAEDAIVLPPDAEMVKGRAAIESFWKGVHDSGVKSAVLTVVDVKSSGELAAELGTAVLTVQPPNQPEAKQNVKYVVTWKKQKDGAWKLYRDIWNAVPSK
jgi:uncharacterized protein (TIGR02246 family)